MERKATKLLSTERYLDFLQDLHTKGVSLSDDKIRMLIDSGRLEVSETNLPEPEKIEEDIPLIDLSVKGEAGLEADEFINIISGKAPEEDVTLVLNEDEFIKNAIFEGGKSIIKDDWMPKSVTEHTKDFVEWIDSINFSGIDFNGYVNMAPYKKFQLYCQQADQWLAENRAITKCKTREERREYIIEELRRCDENSVYFLNRYILLKEANMVSGTMRYEAKPAHYVIAYIFDCGYSFYLGKPRQIAATSTLGALGLKKIIFNKNLFLKMIAQDKDKVQEIFEDKIKYPFGELPVWMKPSVFNDRDNILTLKKKSEKKGTKKGLHSKLQVVAPSVAAINGGSPNIVFVDEAGYIPILGKMVREGRPTMFMQDPETKKLIMKRQLCVWGTGGEMDKGGKAYEEEYMDLILKWRERNFETGIIPLFFNWTSRPGINKEHFDREKKAYTASGADSEDRLVQFRQTYPTIIEDMFLTSQKTLLSINFINSNIERIQNESHDMRPQYGFFEPVFDYNSPADENSDVPYKIIDAAFVQCEEGDQRVSTIMFMPPYKNWVNRYYSGTDPVASDNGFSKMSTTIWDNYFKTIPCVVNYRDSNHKYTFLQNLLVKIYYNTSDKLKAAPNVTESNIGQAYVDYVDYKGFIDSLVLRTELPMILQGGQNMIGLDNRGNRTRVIINKMYEFFSSFADRIYIREYFEQLRTFVCTTTPAGQDTWGTADKRKYFDDMLFSATFAYICSLCYEHIEPKEIKTENDRYVIKYPLVRDKHGKLTREATKIKIH